jgi:DNA-binding FrmR family transcriptional regulator
MTHVIQDKDKLRKRIRRIQGQLEGVQKLLDTDRSCGDVLQTIAACRGAINGLMAEVLEGHIRHHFVTPGDPPGSEQALAAEDVIELVNIYLK